MFVGSCLLTLLLHMHMDKKMNYVLISLLNIYIYYLVVTPHPLFVSINQFT